MLKSLELDSQVVVDHLPWCWELNSRPLQEHWVLLTISHSKGKEIKNWLSKAGLLHLRKVRVYAPLKISTPLL